MATEKREHSGIVRCGQPHSSMLAAEAAWESAAVLKPAPKAEETALLLVFVSRFCHVKI